MKMAQMVSYSVDPLSVTRIDKKGVAERPR